LDWSTPAGISFRLAIHLRCCRRRSLIWSWWVATAAAAASGDMTKVLISWSVDLTVSSCIWFHHLISQRNCKTRCIDAAAAAVIVSCNVIPFSLPPAAAATGWCRTSCCCCWERWCCSSSSSSFTYCRHPLLHVRCLLELGWSSCITAAFLTLIFVCSRRRPPEPPERCCCESWSIITTGDSWSSASSSCACTASFMEFFSVESFFLSICGQDPQQNPPTFVRDNPGISSGWFLEEPSLHRPNYLELSHHAGAKMSVDYEPWAFESFSSHSSYMKIAPSIHDQQVWLQDNILCFKFWNQNTRYIKTVVWILYIYLRFCCWIWCIWVNLHCHLLGGDECCSLLNRLLCNVDDDIAVMLFSWNIRRTNQDLAHISNRITKLHLPKLL